MSRSVSEGVMKPSRWLQMLAQTLGDSSLSALYCGPGENVVRTAEIVGKELRLRHKRINEFRNLDQGLWQGLQIDEIKRRNTKLFRQWIEDPATICPPQGETVERAMERIKTAFRPLIRRHQDEAIGLIVGDPLAKLVASYLRCEPRLQLDEETVLLRIRMDPDRAGSAAEWQLLNILRATSSARDRFGGIRGRSVRSDGLMSMTGGTGHDRSMSAGGEPADWNAQDEGSRYGTEGGTLLECLAWTFRAEARAGEGLDRLRGLPGDPLPQAGRAKPPRLSGMQPPFHRFRGRTDQATPRHRHVRGMVCRPPAGGPLGFNDRRPYPDRVKAEQALTGLNEAAVVGQGFIRGIRIVFGITDSKFIMGSMGSVVGEKLTRAVEEATRQHLPLVIVSGSGGGARMHEGIFSLMQMAKVSTALGRFHAAGGLYLSVLTHPTMGGVAASFASLGDFILAEPKALIGFAGPRVIEQTVRVQLPAGFQTSEFLLEHGFVDRIVHRKDLQSTIAQLITYAVP